MRISDAQWRHPEYIWAYRGSEVHKEVASFSRFVRCSFRDADIKGFGDDYLEPGGLRLHKPSHPRW
jgi:hypothetical protein